MDSLLLTPYNKHLSFVLDMMMDTAVKQQADSNGQSIVTATERQALIQRLYDNFRYFIT